MKTLASFLWLGVVTAFANPADDFSTLPGSRIVLMVVDGSTKRVIENAQVVVQPGGRTSKTSAEGIAEVRDLKAGSYVLVISASGYDRMQALRVNVTDSLPTGVSTSLRGKVVVKDVDIEAPGDGLYLPFMDTPPTLIGGVEELNRTVVYPEMAQRSGTQGTVVVRVYVNDTGLVEKAVVEKSVAPVLDRAALEAVMAIKFQPGKHQGKDVKAVVMIPIAFRLGN